MDDLDTKYHETVIACFEGTEGADYREAMEAMTSAIHSAVSHTKLNVPLAGAVTLACAMRLVVRMGHAGWGSGDRDVAGTKIGEAIADAISDERGYDM